MKDFIDIDGPYYKGTMDVFDSSSFDSATFENNLQQQNMDYVKQLLEYRLLVERFCEITALLTCTAGYKASSVTLDLADGCINDARKLLNGRKSK